MSLLVIFEVLRMFVNILTVDGKYSLRKRENLQQTTEMQFSKKQKSFKEFFAAFLKSTSHFEHFEKQDGPQSSCITEFTDCKNTWLDECLKSPF